MTIDETLARLAMNTGRIAEALEALVSSQGIVPDTAPEPEPTKKKAPAKKKAAKKKAPAKKKANEIPVGKPKEDEPVEYTLKDDVRPILKQLRAEVSHAAVKSLLKKYNASTIQQLDEADYGRIIADAKEDLE